MLIIFPFFLLQNNKNLNAFDRIFKEKFFNKFYLILFSLYFTLQFTRLTGIIEILTTLKSYL